MVYLAGWFVLLFRVIYLLCRKGDVGPNRYGDPAPMLPQLDDNAMGSGPDAPGSAA
jgi:hypothetical protein